MSGLFEHLAANDEMGRIAQRKAIAVATKRVNDRYADFILSEDDADAINERLDLVADEFDQAVQDACDEHGVEDHAPIVAAIRQAFLEKAAKVAKCDCGEPGCECKAGECDCGTKEAASENMPEWLEDHFEEKNEGASKEEEDEDVAEEEDEDEKKESSVRTAMDPEDVKLSPEPPNPELAAQFEARMMREMLERHHREERGGGDLGFRGPNGEVIPGTPGGGGPGGGVGGRGDVDYGEPNPYDEFHKDRQAFSSTKEARRPKMCPYHKELVNASLQVGEPQYAAFSSLVGSDAHCDGGFDGKCNFKPAMVTQAFWDEKEQARLERKEQRELERQQAEQSHEVSPDQQGDEPVAEAVEDQASLSELEDAPSAVGEGVEEPILDSEPALEPALASSRWEITAAPKDGDSWEKNESVEQPEGPSPKMDKSKWNGLDPIDTDAGPYQTVQQDVTEGPDYSKQDDLGIATVDAVTEQTDAVTEQQDLPTSTNVDDAGFNSDKNIDVNHTDTFNNDGQVEPVTQEVMANLQPRTSEEALNLHTADLLGDIGNAAKDVATTITDPTAPVRNKMLDAAGLPVPPSPVDMAGAAAEKLLGGPDEATLQGDPFAGNRPTGPNGQPMTPEQVMQGIQKENAAHKIKEEEGKFYVVEDGDEKAAGPFDSADEAKERATELNAKENLEKETHSKEADAFNDFQNDLKDGLSDKGRELLEEDSYYPAENNDRLDQSIDFMSILVTAIEGGSNYWAEISDVQMNEQFGLPESATFTDHEDPSMGGVVNDEVIRRGIQLARDTQMNPDVKASIFEEGPAMDATAADVVVQLGLFGEIVFG